MTQQEKMEALAEILQEEAGTFTEESALDNLLWDSMAKLSLVALVNERFGKRLSGSQLKDFKTVQDILAVME